MLATNIGIDLGTTSVKIFMQGKGIVLTEPSAVAYNSENKIVGVGQRAYDML
ncbi:MAG: rod shape-determining protein, partial [Clostridia bacterium]|nr:rod shape-determining protein [Clostridia bacterium]